MKQTKINTETIMNKEMNVSKRVQHRRVQIKTSWIYDSIISALKRKISYQLHKSFFWLLKTWRCTFFVTDLVLSLSETSVRAKQTVLSQPCSVCCVVGCCCFEVGVLKWVWCATVCNGEKKECGWEIEK